MTRLTLLTFVLSGLLVGGCSGTKPAPQAVTRGPTTTSTGASTVSPDGTSAPGTGLRLGQRAVVRWRAGKAHQSLAAVTVTAVRHGAVGDLEQFTLTSAARMSTVYYVSAAVRNLGTGNLSGRRLPLFGKVAAHLVVPPVRFTLPFHRCSYSPLPVHFTEGARARVCMVMLAPRHGRISAVQWRSPRLAQPVSWRVR